jgi:hypothetical protein
MFNRFVWNPDRMLLGDLVFRLQHYKSEDWDGSDHFMFYKVKGLVDEYEKFFSRFETFHPRNIVELGIFDGGSTAFWYELLHPEKLIAIDLLDREDNPYFQQFIEKRTLSEKIHTYWKTDQADKPRLWEIVQSEFDGQIDLVLDDCSHLVGPTLASFEALFPLLSPGGFYIVEDWAWGHWPQCWSGKWLKHEPLTSLILKFVEAIGTSNNLISSIAVYHGFTAIERSNNLIADVREFSIENSILRLDLGKPMVSRPPESDVAQESELESHVKELTIQLRSLQQSVPVRALMVYRKILDRIFKPNTRARHAYDLLIKGAKYLFFEVPIHMLKQAKSWWRAVRFKGVN